MLSSFRTKIFSDIKFLHLFTIIAFIIVFICIYVYYNKDEKLIQYTMPGISEDKMEEGFANTNTYDLIKNTVTGNNTKPSYITLEGPSAVSIGDYFIVKAYLDAGEGDAYWAMDGIINKGCRNPGCGFYAPSTPGIITITYNFSKISGTLNIQVLNPNSVSPPPIPSPPISPPPIPSPPISPPPIPSDCNANIDISNIFEGSSANLDIYWYNLSLSKPKLIVQYNDSDDRHAEIPEKYLSTRRDTGMPVVQFSFYKDSIIRDANSVLVVDKVNNVVFGSFQNQKCLLFNGTNSYVKMKNKVAGSAFCSFTTKLYVSSFSGRMKQNRFFCIRQGGDTSDITSNMTNSVAIEGGINGNDGSVTISLKCNTTTDFAKNMLLVTSPRNIIKPNIWYHIGVVFTDCMTNCKLYINGLNIAEKNNDRITEGFYTDRIYDYAAIGHGYSAWSDNTSPMPFNGGIAWQHWYDYPLTDNDVVSDMNNTNKGIDIYKSPDILLGGNNRSSDESPISDIPLVTVKNCFLANPPEKIMPNPYVFKPEKPPILDTSKTKCIGNVMIVSEVGQGVWGTQKAWIGNAIPNSGIKWIWASSESIDTPEVGYIYVFFNDFNNTSGSSKKYKITGCIDNYGRIFILKPEDGLDFKKGIDIYDGPNNSIFEEKTIILPAGISRIIVIGMNGGAIPKNKFNPGGLWLTLTDAETNKVVFKTDECWIYQGFNTGNIKILGEILLVDPWGSNFKYFGEFGKYKTIIHRDGAPPFWMWIDGQSQKDAWYSFEFSFYNPFSSPIPVKWYIGADSAWKLILPSSTLSGTYYGTNNNMYMLEPGKINIRIEAQCRLSDVGGGKGGGVWFSMGMPIAKVDNMFTLQPLVVSGNGWTWAKM